MNFRGMHSLCSVFIVFGGQGSILEVSRTGQNWKKCSQEGQKRASKKKMKTYEKLWKSEEREPQYFIVKYNGKSIFAVLKSIKIIGILESKSELFWGRGGTFGVQKGEKKDYFLESEEHEKNMVCAMFAAHWALQKVDKNDKEKYCFSLTFW